MHHRPLVLVILGALHILEPVGKLLYYKLFMPELSEKIIASISHMPFIDLFTWLGLFPLAGLAILAVKSWSLPVFLAIESYVIYSNLALYLKMYERGLYLDLISLIVFALINIIVVCYLLIPAVRTYYTDPKLRWWEAYPRYSVKLPIKIKGFGELMAFDISRSGIFAKKHDDIKIGDIVPVSFCANNKTYSLNAKVVAFFNKGQIEGMGLQFLTGSFRQKYELYMLSRAWEKQGIERRPRRRNILSEIKLSLYHTLKRTFRF